MRQTIYFNKIYIIESLKENDKKTGSVLYNDLIRHRVNQMDGFSAELICVDTKPSFMAALKGIFKDTDPNESRPYLHFEIHGSKDGFELTNGESVSWEELYLSFSEINGLLRNQLFISLATCFGGYLFEIIDPSRRAPFFGFVGNTSTISSWEIEIGYYEYFDTLLQTLDLDKAIESLNLANSHSKVPYVPLVSGEIFHHVATKLKAQMKNRKLILSKRKQLEKQAKKNSKIKLQYSKSGLKDAIKKIVWNYPRQMEVLEQYFLFQRDTVVDVL